jgi:hypothetical protein
MMLDKYVADNDILLLSVQETGMNKQFKCLTNMRTYEDTNQQQNKGCAIFVNNKAMFTPLPEISMLSKSIDTVWGILKWQSKSYIIGNVYLKLDYQAGINDYLKMQNKAADLAAIHKCSGVLVMGDFNARHQIWNDISDNKYGKLLEQGIDWTKYCIRAPSERTFLAGNGGSLIDFFVASTSLDKYISKVRTDYGANLYSGAPLRGHVPVLMELNSTVNTNKKEVKKKIDMNTMDWINWTRDLEIYFTSSTFKSLLIANSTEEICSSIDGAIKQATESNCQKKTVSPHSKPFWTKELTSLSENLRKAQKRYITRNTDDNLTEFKQAKDDFEQARKLACQQFIMEKTRNLNVAQASKFWKEFNRLFKPPSDQQVEATEV